MVETPATEMLREQGEHGHHEAVRTMGTAYLAASQTDDLEAITTVIDFFGAAGTFASCSTKV